MIVALDSTPLGLLSNPSVRPANDACNQWLQRLLAAGVRVFVSQIVDYEVRRELIRARRVRGLARLDRVVEDLEELPINRAVMRRAAELWAQARQRGRPTADPASLDADSILAAQVQLLAAELPDEVVVLATSNVRHLGHFVDARPWQDIAVP